MQISQIKQILKQARLVTPALVALVAVASFATTAHAAATSSPTSTLSSSTWAIVSVKTSALPTAFCDKVKGRILQIRHEVSAQLSSSACEDTVTLEVNKSTGPISNTIIGGGGGGCTARSTNWKQYQAFSTFGAAYYYQQTGKFTSYSNCSAPTDYNHHCADAISASPGVSVSNTACYDWYSSGYAYAQGDYYVGVFGITTTNYLDAKCDLNGNVTDPSIIAD
jgi:hypothetical protein